MHPYGHSPQIPHHLRDSFNSDRHNLAVWREISSIRQASWRHQHRERQLQVLFSSSHFNPAKPFIDIDVLAVQEVNYLNSRYSTDEMKYLIPLLLIFLAGCVVVQREVTLPQTQVPLPEKQPDIIETTPVPEISYTLFSEIQGLFYLKPNETLFLGLVDTKTNPLEREKFKVADGVYAAHKVWYNMTTNYNVQIVVVPNYAEYEKLTKGQPYKSYDCSGLVSECEIGFDAGMVFINKENKQVQLSRHTQVMQPVIQND